MPHLNRKQIQQRVRELLLQAPGGMRWGELHKAVLTLDPETPPNSITGAMTHLLGTAPDIVKVARGTYQLAVYQDAQAGAAQARDQASAAEPIVIESSAHDKVMLVESDFYASFAEWLAEGAEEVNKAVVLGGNVLKGKWGTPDVIGVLRPLHQDLLKFEPQIVSAEIKIDPAQPVVAFGQAIAYRLFSHKSYIAVPDIISQDDLSRLKALCSIHGVGLVTFALDKDSPDYALVVLPQQASPDMFYANQMLRRLLETAPKLFNALFGG